MTPAARTPWTTAALLIGLSTGLAIGALELTCRLLGLGQPQLYGTDAIRGYKLLPNVSAHWQQEGNAAVRTNSAGYRDQERPLTRSAGTLRIAVLGDSFTEALQLPLEKTWVHLLPAALARQPTCPLLKRFPKGVEVLNFGVGGYGTGQAWLTWRQDARHYRPQVVLHAAYLENDLRDNLVGGSGTAPAPTFKVVAGGLQIDNDFRRTPGYRFRSSPFGQATTWLLSHSRLLQLLNQAKNRLQPRAGEDCPVSGCTAFPLGTDGEKLYGPNSGDLEPGWPVIGAILLRWNDEVQAAGSRLVVTSLTTPPQLWPNPTERDAAARRHRLDWFRPEARLAAILKPHAIPYLPLAPGLQQQADAHGLVAHGFRGQRPGPGYGHWNADGHRAAAEELAQQLCRLSLDPS